MYVEAAYVESGELSRCIIVSNSARGSWGSAQSAHGGGVYVEAGRLRDCVVAYNEAVGSEGYWNEWGGMPGGSAYGGGIRLGSGDALNCSIVSNYVRAGFTPMGWEQEAGSGVDGGTVLNTILHGNTGTTPLTDQLSGTAATYSCSPSLASGTGNITNNPSFRPGAGHLLAADSPCRDMGQNDFRTECGEDVYGVPRQLNGRVDMGASEFWEMAAPPHSGAGGLEVRWNVVTDLTYTVQRSTNLLSSAWSDAVPATNPSGPMLVFPEPAPPPTAAYRVLTRTGN